MRDGPAARQDAAALSFSERSSRYPRIASDPIFFALVPAIGEEPTIDLAVYYCGVPSSPVWQSALSLFDDPPRTRARRRRMARAKVAWHRDDAGERTGTRDNVFIIAVGIWAVVMVVLMTSALVLLVQIMREMRIISECGSMA